ncbi:hypothetical protein lerEdw1_016053 [Lerista edwardsae]|nr:hypothetical protein lerEdw1_016053 [Lerista edwardsae]
MMVLTSPLHRKFLYLFPRHALFGMHPARDSIPNPCQKLLRHCLSYKLGLVTASELVNYWTDVFERNEIPEAEASSQYIVSHVLGAKTFQSLSAESISTPLSAKQQEQVKQLCAKRLQRMPVQYVLGEWDFQDLTLKMKPPVFIPRPETEASPPKAKDFKLFFMCPFAAHAHKYLSALKEPHYETAERNLSFSYAAEVL